MARGRKRSERRVLGRLELAMFKALKNDPRERLTKRWKYSSAHDLIGIKVQDRFSGDMSVTFDLVPREEMKDEQVA